MNVNLATVDYVSKYVDLLNGVEDHRNTLAPLKMSILYSQRNQPNGNNLKNIENYCQHCLTPWKLGNFTVKTFPIRPNRNSKLLKTQDPPKLSFILALKCLACLKTTSSMFGKKKILKKKSIEKQLFTENSLFVEHEIGPSKAVEEKLNTTEKKKKKKKKIPFAGLNPLVFKNRNSCKK